jgi:hypothetical protein
MRGQDLGLRLDPGEPYGEIVDVTEFCELLSIKFESKSWEGGRVDGFYKYGWLKSRAETKAKELATEILRRLEAQLAAA